MAHRTSVLEKRAACEEKTSYAIIYTGAVPDIADIFGYPFEDGPVLEGLQVNLERGQWSASAPGTGTQEALAQFQTYSGHNFGNVNTTEVRTETTDLDRVYIANKNNIAQFTNVYRYIAAPPTYTDLLPLNPTYGLMALVIQQNDAVVFGIDAAEANSGPFCSILLDIATAQANCNMTWYYWTGVWTAFPAGSFLDYTDATGQPLTRTGRCGFHFRQQSNWVSGTPGVIPAGWWVQCRVTNVPVGPVTPTQQNNDPYTANWGSIPIEENDIGGDIAALLKLQMHVRSLITTPSGDPQLSSHRFIVGLRSDSRGTNFSAYINTTNVSGQNPTGVTVADFSPGITVVEPMAPAGRCWENIFAGVAPETLGTITFTTPATAAAYHGIFRVFVRVHQTAGPVGFGGIYLIYANGLQYNWYKTSETVMAQSLDTQEILDMGLIAMPGRYPAGVDTEHSITVVAVSLGAHTMQVHDIIFMPVDEWAADIRAIDADSLKTASFIGYPVQIDSLTVPKHFIHARQIDTSDVLQSWWTPIANGPAILQPTTGQKLWVLATNVPDGETYEVAPIAITSTVGVWHNERYLLPRGTT